MSGQKRPRSVAAVAMDYGEPPANYRDPYLTQPTLALQLVAHKHDESHFRYCDHGEWWGPCTVPGCGLFRPLPYCACQTSSTTSKTCRKCAKPPRHTWASAVRQCLPSSVITTTTKPPVGEPKVDGPGLSGKIEDARRADRRLTVSEIARRAGCDRKVIQRLKDPGHQVRLSTAVKLAQASGIDVGAVYEVMA